MAGLRELNNPVVDQWMQRVDRDLAQEADQWRSIEQNKGERFEY